MNLIDLIVDISELTLQDIILIITDIFYFFMDIVDNILDVPKKLISVFQLIISSINNVLSFFGSESGFITYVNQAIGVFPVALVSAAVLIIGVYVIYRLVRII